MVLSVHYRQAPEHKFPAAHEDAVAAYRWAVSKRAQPRRRSEPRGGGRRERRRQPRPQRGDRRARHAPADAAAHGADLPGRRHRHQHALLQREHRDRSALPRRHAVVRGQGDAEPGRPPGPAPRRGRQGAAGRPAAGDHRQRRTRSAALRGRSAGPPVAGSGCRRSNAATTRASRTSSSAWRRPWRMRKPRRTSSAIACAPRWAAGAASPPAEVGVAGAPVFRDAAPPRLPIAAGRPAGHTGGNSGRRVEPRCSPKNGGRIAMYPNVQLHIAGEWRDARSGKTIPVVNPATEEVIGQVAHAEQADLDEALEAAERGFAAWRKVSAYDRAKVMRKAADLLRSRADAIARLMTQEQGKPLAEAKMETLAGRRPHRVVRRGRAPRLWPRHPGARGRRVPARRPRAGGAGRRLHAVELPDQPGGAQALGRGRHRLLHHRQGAGGDARLARRADPRLPRRRRAGRRGLPRLRRAGGDQLLPHRAPGHPQGDLHRLHAGRQAARGAGRAAHEAGDDGARRPRAGHRLRRRRPRPRRQDARRRQVPQRRAGLRLARRASWCRRSSTSPSSRSSSRRRRR